MHAVLALVVAVTLLTGCSDDGDPAPATPITTPHPELDAAAQVAVEYVEAVRNHDAGAIYALGWSGLQKKETRAAFIRRTKFTGVSDARVSGTITLGWDARARRMAIVPIIVTAGGAPQVGRVLLLKEGSAWRYFDLAVPDQVPDLTDERP